MKRMHTPHIELLKTCNRLQGILLYLLNLCEPKSYPERNRCFMLFFQKHIFRHTEQLLARMASFAACECGAEEQTVDHVVLQCPIHRPPHGLHGLTVLDDETTDWLLNICPEI